MRRALGIGLALLLCSLVAVGVWLYAWLLHELPRPEDVSNYIALQEGTWEHSPVSLLDLPDALRWATLSTLDPQFYARPTGIQPQGLARAVWLALTRENLGRDGASLTDYLVQDLIAVSGRRVDNPRRQRMRELVLTIAIAQCYTKDQVLGMYLNSTSYGNGVYGAEAAAQYYYGKHVRELNLAESAMLVSIWRMGELDWSEGLERVERGQAGVLEAMVWQGYITREQARQAEEDSVSFVHQVGE